MADGYGRNYLIPKKLAYQATPGNLKVVEDEKRSKDLREYLGNLPVRVAILV